MFTPSQSAKRAQENANDQAGAIRAEQAAEQQNAVLATSSSVNTQGRAALIFTNPEGLGNPTGPVMGN